MAVRDEASFEAFVAERSGDLLRTALLLTHDRGHAEDLFQVALVKAYRHWPRIAAEDPYPYVRRVLVNGATSWRRLRATQEIVALPPRDQPVADATEMVAERERLMHALGSLPVRMRTVLVLRYAEDLSEAATAEAMGCSVATVKTHAARGLARSRVVLGPPTRPPSWSSADMAMSDSDLEVRLRDLRAQVDLSLPPAHDLAERTRQGFRAQRRHRAALAATGLVAALVLVGVPVGSSVLLGQRGSGETVGDPAPPLPDGGLYDMPTRGSLADDRAWVAGVRALAWPPADGEVPSTADRRVVFAGDVPGARVALVLGRLARATIRLWLVGPEGAAPADMRPALAPAEMPDLAPADVLDGQRLALWDAPDPAADTGVLVVIAFPGETAEFVPGVVRPVDGVVVETLQPFELADGVGIRTVPRPVGWPFATVVGVLRGDYSDEVRPDFSDRAAAALGAPTLDDPRGLRSAVPQAWLDEATGWLVESFGTPGVSLPLTLLYAGGVRDTATQSAVAVGATLPSGATVVGLSVFTGTWAPSQSLAEKGAGGWGATTTGTSPRPAGAPLLEQVLALSIDGILTVSGPATGVTAEVLGADGRTVTRFALVGGAGASVSPKAVGVRILDAGGAVVAEAALTDVG